MASIQIIAGCPFLDKHNQTPGLVTDDPLEAISEYGNYGCAIELLTTRIGRGRARATDYELLAYALRSIGRPAEAAENYRNALSTDPNHKRASYWRQHVHECERTARNGSYVLRSNGITADRLMSASHLPPGTEAHAWVLDHSGWIKPNGYIPRKSLGDRVMNMLYARLSDALAPVGRFVNRLVPERPNSAGRWTLLPNYAKGILRLADLASRRDWMLDNARLPPGTTQSDKDHGPDFLPNAFSPDGRGNNPTFRNVGGVGTSVPFHGLPEDYKARDRANDARLPSAAAVAKDFGYRNGRIQEALTASAHAWGHLQLLVHDVLQTAPDDVRKHPVPVAPGSEEAEIGIRNVHYRSDATNPLGGPGNGRMNSVTGAWDLSPIYGNSVEQIARIRTNPNTGKPCPDGKIYLAGMDEKGKGGLFLPTESNENGEEVLLTGFARNMTMPLEAEHTLYARHHNWVCEVLRERHPDWDGNQIFNIARRVVAMTYVKIHTAPWTDALFAHLSVVQGLHANVFGHREWKKPVNQQRIYDPRGGSHPIADGLVSNQELDFEIPEAKGNNFNDAYRFGHTIVPDIHYFPQIGEKTVKGKTEAIDLRDLRDLDGHRFLVQRGLGFAFHGLMNTRLGAPVAGNYADLFRRMDTEEGMVDLFEAEIVKDRQRGTPAYSDYLRSHNLPPLTSFTDLFKDPQNPDSKEQIAKLEAHYPGGVEDLDTPLGLLMNQFRPEGFAITNPGFQTFVFEATARIAKQIHLTRLWSPEHVGWTAINLVEAMDKEKLLYLHCPELRKYLETRPNRNTYEYMGTSPETHPEEHPLAKILTYGDEDLADVGLGDPWRDEHFDEKALEEHYLIRVHHKLTDRTFVVDLTERTVRFDRNNDGRILRSEIMREDPVTVVELLAAAQNIRDTHRIPWPGCECTYDANFASGWRLTPAETKKLKMFEGDEKKEGVPARLTDLQVHILIFNLGDDIERAHFYENVQGWKAVEQSPLRAQIMSLMSALAFGASLFSFAIPTHVMAKKRPTKSTGIFDRNGMIDQAKLGEYRAALQELAAQSDDDHVSKDAFMKLLRERGALGLTTRNQWGSLFRLMKRMHGRETITVDAFDKLYSGKLLIEAWERFAPGEMNAKLAARPRN
jgi:hypothetical protein